jgi:hypothetical protein
MENKLPREHVDIQFLSLCVSLLAFLGLAYWAGDIIWIKDFQPFITLISGIFAIFIGVIALLRYYTKKTALNFLFIGIGFLCVGVLDIFQVVLDLGGISNLFSGTLNQVYPVTSVLSKTFLAVIMFVSWVFSRQGSKETKEKKKTEVLLMSIVAASFVVFIGIFLYLMAKGIIVDSLAVIIVGLISLMFLILAFLGYLLNKGWYYDDFNYWIIFLLAFLILSQIFYLPFFNLEYANMMNLSVWARFFAYIGLLTGFLNSIYVMFRKEIEIQKELAEKNKQLDETKAKVEEAYLMLRQEKWDMARSKGSVDKILKDVLKKK